MRSPAGDNKLRLVKAIAGICLLQPLGAVPQASSAGARLDRSQLRLVFQEEFDSPPSFYDDTIAPRGRWKTNFAFGSQDRKAPRYWETRTLLPNNELQYYADPWRDADAFEWRDGMLTIAARPASAGEPALEHGLSYVSGLITSEKSFLQRYGYFEARVRMPVGKGLWPAFWLRPRFRVLGDPKLPQPPAEIDVFENIGKREELHLTVHYGTRQDKRHDSIALAVAPVDAFHVYGVLVSERDIVWYIDEQEVHRKPNHDFHHPAYMLLNLAVGGDWPGSPDGTTSFPAQMTIDWVRAHALAPSPVPLAEKGTTYAIQRSPEDGK